jgi:hypothetical protein
MDAPPRWPLNAHLGVGESTQNLNHALLAPSRLLRLFAPGLCANVAHAVHRQNEDLAIAPAPGLGFVGDARGEFVDPVGGADLFAVCARALVVRPEESLRDSN